MKSYFSLAGYARSGLGMAGKFGIMGVLTELARCRDNNSRRRAYDLVCLRRRAGTRLLWRSFQPLFA